MASSTAPRQHGVKGVYYGGDWLDLEDCHTVFSNPPDCSGCDDAQDSCPRSRSRNTQRSSAKRDYPPGTYDVLIVGAGCIGAAVARQLAQYKDLSILWVEAADDVSQGATKGNSGIVHAGYDDTPGSNRAKFCWKGNQMFAGLDKELRFGYQTNGSLVVAFTKDDLKELEKLKKRGETNGVERLKIVSKKELLQMEPSVHPDALAALYSPDAGNVIPYEYAIALAENAVDNGVELRIRRLVTAVSQPEDKDGLFEVDLQYWEPKEYIKAVAASGKGKVLNMILSVIGGLVSLHWLSIKLDADSSDDGRFHVMGLVFLWPFSYVATLFGPGSSAKLSKNTPMTELVQKAGPPAGKSSGKSVKVDDMLIGGSGSRDVMNAKVIGTEKVRCKYVINCAGGGADKVANLIGDYSFKIKPRLGDYILLNRSQGYLAKHTLFPCPDPVLGKGVLVQTTLWGNLILGPTARDMYKAEARDMTNEEIQRYILSKCKCLVQDFDPKETIHAFCGARAKSDRGDWIIEPSQKNPKFIHVAGIDSPGLAGSPAIALEVARILKDAGLAMHLDPNFKKNRAPIITPKAGMKGLKMGPVGKFDSDGSNMEQMAANVICKCEKVTELEVVRAMRRSLPIDSSQGIRKRTRAGMGHCQGDPDNFNCEARVRAIIARENGVPIDQVGSRPWPATSTLSQRWIDDEEKSAMEDRMMDK